MNTLKSRIIQCAKVVSTLTKLIRPQRIDHAHDGVVALARHENRVHLAVADDTLQLHEQHS